MVTVKLLYLERLVLGYMGRISNEVFSIMATTNLGLAQPVATDTVDVAAHITTPFGIIDDLMDGDVTPSAIGSASAGTNVLEASRADHVHPIGSSTVTTAALNADAVTGAKIADDAIDSEHYVDGSIDAAHLASSAVTTAKINADAVTGAKIADDALDSEHYTDGSIDTVHLAADAVTGAKIADDALDSEHYTDGSVDSAHLAADVVTGAKIADNALDSEHYTDGSIDTAHIADNQVTLAKLSDGTQGGVLYYAASGVPTELSAGTSGYFLKTQGASANPVWAAVAGGAFTPKVINITYFAMSGNGSSGGVQANNDALYMPIQVDGDMTITKISFYIATSSGNVDVGIYDSSGTKAVSLGSTSSPGTGVRTFTVGSTALTAGQYYVALAVDNTTFKWGQMSGAALMGTAMMQRETSDFPLPSSFTVGAWPTANTHTHMPPTMVVS